MWKPWSFILETNLAITPILWPSDAKSWLIWKDPDAGKDWGQEEKGTTEDEMVGWHHRLDGHGFGWTLGIGDGQGGLACCDSWGRRESDMTQRLNWTVKYLISDWIFSVQCALCCSCLSHIGLGDVDFKADFRTSLCWLISADKGPLSFLPLTTCMTLWTFLTLSDQQG